MRVIARDGYSALTVRAVAAEAGWSVGALQKSFATVEDLVRAAVAVTVEAADARIAATPQTGCVIDDLAEMVEQTLPLDQTRRNEAKVWSALTRRAVDVSWMADIFIAQDRMVLDQLRSALTDAQDRALVPAHTDPTAVATIIVALADGLAARLLYHPESEPEARRALRYALASLLGIS